MPKTHCPATSFEAQKQTSQIPRRSLSLDPPSLILAMTITSIVVSRSFKPASKPPFIGFSNTHIQSSIKRAPQLLFAKVDKTLKPKIEFFKNLGIVGLELAHLISKSYVILKASLERRIVHCIEILKEVLVNDGDDKGLVKVLLRCNRIMGKDPKSFLLSNIALFESYGIVGSQLATLLRGYPRLFIMQESVLRDLLLKHGRKNYSSIPDWDLLKSNKLLRRDRSFLNVLYLSEKVFLERYVSRFRDDAEELLVVYKGHILDPSI
ncbi:unnamed protein product [Dovyalis caffra]|uniref:Uncharacterized protein n=1 Tax=Dovyalis caffra TaxID=77055 RepID=A0AAV1RQP3_9ROSI|nr:unnamed protein product [Dovyalis caffra]